MIYKQINEINSDSYRSLNMKIFRELEKNEVEDENQDPQVLFLVLDKKCKFTFLCFNRYLNISIIN